MWRLQIEKANSQFLLNANCRKTAFVVVCTRLYFSINKELLKVTTFNSVQMGDM